MTDHGLHRAFKPTRAEMETIIRGDELDKNFSVYTYNSSLKRRLKEFSESYPELCQLKAETSDGSVTYVVDKSRLKVRLVPPVSEERRQALRDRMMNNSALKKMSPEAEEGEPHEQN